MKFEFMDGTELKTIIARGEDSKHQFKSDVTHADALGAEMAAFANTNGGMILIGVDDNGAITGLSNEAVQRINQLIGNAANQNVSGPVNPLTENIETENGLVIVVEVPEGINKPYFDRNGVVWVKSGADKRKVNSREELRRMFQSADLVHADEIPVPGSTTQDLDYYHFREFYNRVFEEELDDTELSITTILNNLNLGKADNLNLAGLLLFGKNPQKFKPQFIIKCVYFVGTSVETTQYRDSIDIDGPIKAQYDNGMAFIKRNLHAVQNGKSVNSIGELEIPDMVFEELLVNALLHRDYFISAPIRLFILDDRIEIISPGILPNNLKVENIKSGVSNIRNSVLTSFAIRELPYRGIGTGIRRALKAYDRINFENDIDNEQFRVIIERPENQ